MADTGRHVSPSPSDALVERVRQRLNAAGQRFDRRAAATRPTARQRKQRLLTGSSQQTPADSQHRRERACLRAVFHELGDAHRGYRARTGHAVTPELRAATAAFKQEPSLLSLVPVAAFLDELGLLAW
jgi:hypothetical protein